ncbi:MAG: septum site-determining protein MinC, partial [Gammaproteobacteria bacterium]
DMTSKKALEFKGRMLSLTRARILDPDVQAIASQLEDFARQMPQAVKGMPVILEAESALDLGAVLAAMRGVGMQPLGVVDGPLAASAANWGLPVLAADAGGSRGTRTPAAEPAPAAAAARRSTRIVTAPVRSGQQVYAADGDLVVVNSVSVGAEVAADGCVHVYGTLRGRAMAGARGDPDARIFCRRFEAELVAVAGVYAVAEQMQGELRGKPVQVWLADGKLRIERLES